jgi:hypothetical protein
MKPKSLISILIPFVLLAVLISAASGQIAWKGTEEQRDGVLHVMNPSSPIEEPLTMKLEELWRLGGDSEADEEFFGVIGAITTDDASNVYLLDRQLAEVKVFTPDGDYLRTIGHEGEGPGEFRRPTDMFMTPGGDVGVLQMRPGKVVLLTTDGDPAGEFTVGPRDAGFSMLRSGESAGKHMVMAYGTGKMEEGKMTRLSLLVSCDSNGEEIARFHEEEAEMNFAKPVVDETNGMTPTWALGPDGKIYVVSKWGDYSIRVHSPDGPILHVVTREYEHLDRSKEEMESARGRFVFRGVNPEVVVSEYEPDVRGMFPRPDGSLWVLTSRGERDSEGTALGTFDVFDSQGRFTHQVTIEAEGDPRDDAIFMVGDRLFVVTEFVSASRSMWGGGDGEGEGDEEEARPMEVICYRLGEGGIVASTGAGR